MTPTTAIPAAAHNNTVSAVASPVRERTRPTAEPICEGAGANHPDCVAGTDGGGATPAPANAGATDAGVVWTALAAGAGASTGSTPVIPWSATCPVQTRPSQ